MEKIILIVTLIAVLGMLALTYKQPSSQITSNKLRVATSFYPLYFFTKEIGGEFVEVKNITPAGAEPHDYEPTAQDIAAIESSQILILNGGGLEAWGEKIKNNLGAVNIITASKSIGETITDPHTWLSPPLARREAKYILDNLVQINPIHKIDYQKNADLLFQKLDELDQKYKKELSTCAQKDIVTSHAAFGYLAATYDLRQVAIAGLSPDEEPSPKRLTEIAKYAKENKIQYIFFESLVSPKLAQTVATEIGAKTLVLDPIEGLSDEDMKNGKNYFTIMEDNLKNLKIALSCT